MRAGLFILASAVSLLGTVPVLATPAGPDSGVIRPNAEEVGAEPEDGAWTLEDYLRTALLRNPGVRIAFRKEVV